jgi:hypothetical protein
MLRPDAPGRQWPQALLSVDETVSLFSKLQRRVKVIKCARVDDLDRHDGALARGGSRRSSAFIGVARCPSVRDPLSDRVACVRRFLFG